MQQDDEYYEYYETNATEVKVDLKGKYVVNVVAVIQGSIPLRLVYSYKEIEKSKFQNKMWFVIIFPCCFVLSLVLIFASLKADKCCVDKNVVPGTCDRLIPVTVGPEHEPELKEIDVEHNA